jgi:phosphonate transport system ATP-binding protein
MIKIENLTYTYKNNITGVKNINLHIEQGKLVTLIGLSGSGKSTLLRCINRLLEPSSGNVLIDGSSIINCKEKEVRKIRKRIGMVFQNFNLLQRSLVIQNVLIGRLGSSLIYSKRDKEIALDCLRRVGIEDLAYRRVEALSGGQQQRVGIARALAQEPSILLADEPVSNLDPSKKKEIMDLISNIHKEEKITTVISLHDIDIAKEYSNRLIALSSGSIIFDGSPKELTSEKISNIFT